MDPSRNIQRMKSAQGDENGRSSKDELTSSVNFDVPLEDLLENSSYELIESDDERDARSKVHPVCLAVSFVIRKSLNSCADSLQPTPWIDAYERSYAAASNITSATAKFGRSLSTAGVGRATAAVVCATASSTRATIGPQMSRCFKAVKARIMGSKGLAKEPTNTGEECRPRIDNKKLEELRRPPSPNSSPIAMVGDDMRHWPHAGSGRRAQENNIASYRPSLRMKIDVSRNTMNPDLERSIDQLDPWSDTNDEATEGERHRNGVRGRTRRLSDESSSTAERPSANNTAPTTPYSDDQDFYESYYVRRSEFIGKNASVDDENFVGTDLINLFENDD
jgi:hypothetical protein